MYKKTANKLFKHLDFFIFDLLIVALTYAFACMQRYQFHVPARWAGLFVRCGAALLVIFFLVALISQNYRDILQRNKWVELGRVLLQVVLTFVAFILYLYLINENDFSRQIYLVTAGLSFLLMWCERVFWKHMLRMKRAKDNNLPQLLVICERDAALSVLPSIRQKQYDYFRVKGVVLYGSAEDFDDLCTGGEKPGIYRDYIITPKPMKKGRAGSGELDQTSIVCAPDQLRAYLLNGVVDEIFISLRDEQEEQRIIRYCMEMGIIVHMGLASVQMDYPHAAIEKLGDNTVLTTSMNTTDSWKLIVKRCVDILGGAAGCLVMLLLCLIVGPKIRKADPGPIFFRQERVGKNGRTFKIYKFRSMYLDAEERKKELMARNEMSGQIFKLKNDPRILPGIGEKIRQSSIDEWPQFINVLKGDMSLVGTRPPTVDEYAQYEPHHKARLSFKPGITGLWQVSGRSRITDFEKIVELDNTYIREWSLGLDAKILIRTVGVVLRHEGAE